MPTRTSVVPVERIEAAILLIRGQKVMLDTDLAPLWRRNEGADSGRSQERGAIS